MNKKLKIAAAVCTAVLLTASVTLSGVTLWQQTKLTGYFLADTKDVAQEDDVKIAGEYVIKSTLPISDAYKSGDTSKLSDRDKETLDMAKAVIDEVITDKMTDFEKEQAIYRYLTKGMTASTEILTVIHESSAEADNPHDTLKNHSAVCVGYATTFRLFMQMMGIDCMVCHSSDLIHSWDMVRLDDDCWYHVDCYMDSGSANYSNFNMDDRACEQNHTWNTEFFPKADGTKYNYLLFVCEKVKDIYSVPKWVMNAIAKKKEVISCSFEKPPVKDEDQYIASYLSEQLTERINYSDKVTAEYRWLKNDEGQYVLAYVFSYVDDNSDKLSQKTKDKLDSRIEKALEDADFYEKYYDNGEG